MAIIRPDGRYEQVNPAMCALTGYTEAELTQLSIADITHRDDIADDLVAVAALVAGERDSVALEKRYLRPTGECIWAVKSATMMRTNDSPQYIISQLTDITAAKKAERVLLEEHHRVQRAEFIGQVGSWELDLTTDIVTWSAGLSRLMGREPVACASDLDATMANIHADDREAARVALQVCARTGEPQRLRYRINRGGDGVIRWMDTRTEALYEDGRVVRIDGVVADVTEQAEAEQASASARSFQQAVMTASPDIMFVWDLPSQSAVWTNRRLTDELGYTDAQHQDATVDAIDRAVPAELRGNYEATVLATVAALSDDATELDLPVLHADGTRRWYSRRIAPLHRDENGTVTQVVGVLRDTTETMQTQQALRESESKFRQLADNIDVAFTLRTWEPDEFLYVSPGFERIFGYDPLSAAEPPTQTLNRIHPEDQARFMSDYWAVCRAGRPVRHEYRIVRPDGEIRWVRATSSPVATSGDGEPRRSASIVADITESRQAEAALLSAQQAESASAAKNEFLGRMSHELRTPMNAILGFAQLLELDADPGPQQEAVQHILRGGRHLISLIDDVLDIASIEGDRLELNEELVSVSNLLVETTALMSPVAAAAQVDLICHAEQDGEHQVLADARRLRQVLLNLLSNAIKYNHPGGQVEIHCELTPTAPETARRVEDSGGLDIVVTDTGRGIRAEDLPRLFTPFDRLGVQAHGIDGTGVGLALSQRLMTMMGGGLRATSDYGVGSSFIASLALTRPADSSSATEPAATAPSGTATTTGHRTRSLLYIEDVSSNVELMESVIKRSPRWRMSVAGYGRLGQELAATAKPDLVLLDRNLPDVSGEDVLRHLRADPRTRNLPIVILSADASPHQINRMMAAGADGYLTKPIAVSDILQLLETHDDRNTDDADGTARPPVRVTSPNG